WLSSFESPAHPVKSLTSNCPAPGAHSTTWYVGGAIRHGNSVTSTEDGRGYQAPFLTLKQVHRHNVSSPFAHMTSTSGGDFSMSQSLSSMQNRVFHVAIAF